MRKKISLLALLLLVLLLPAVLGARHALPSDTHGMIEKKYSGWSGVLRLWVCETWLPGAGSLSPWLNRCIEIFEKQHDGVYVQPRYVAVDVLASLGESGLLPPDMILFPAGALAAPDRLLPLDADSRVRPGLVISGTWNGTIYAQPVALGGYAWAYDRRALSGIPGNWETSGARITCPPDDIGHQWSAALLALCATAYTPGLPSTNAQQGPSFDMDLGLSLPSHMAEPTASPTPTAREGLPCRLPEDFAFSDSAYRDFINGTVAAIPVTQKEARRLQSLANQGKGPDWHIGIAGAPFTDQLTTIAVLENAAAPERQSLCLDFINHLLSDASQGELHRAGAFSVTSADSGYAANDPLRQLDASLRRDDLIVPPVFGAVWKEKAETIVRKFIDGSGEAPALWSEFVGLFNK